MVEIDAEALLQLLMYVRTCSHPERYVSDPSPGGGDDRWCMGCGSVRIQGRWLTPSWFQGLDKALRGINGEPMS